MVKAQLKCVDCGRLIWVGRGQEPLCQNCKNRRSGKGTKPVRILSSKVDLQEEVKALIWAEHRFPQFVDKLRKGKKNEKV